ncbi:MAG: IclR family transcriptional regulator [Propionibacteriaceae bacterium]|nr:IclR family transcriptional regulator [Propionibacteriaceae bacterium]
MGSLLRGLHILDMFSREHTSIGIGEMAQELGLHKSSASRLASTLGSAGYLQLSGSAGTYELGPRLTALGVLAGMNTDIQRIVLPYLERLTWLTGETGHLAEREGKFATTLAVTDGWYTVRMHSWQGKLSPAYCSSMGMILLAAEGERVIRDLYKPADLIQRTPHTVTSLDALVAETSQVVQRGYSIDDEELEEGLRCIGAPIVNAFGQIDASISISGPAQRVTLERIPLLAEHVRYAAWQASRARGATTMPAGWPQPPHQEPALLEWAEAVRAATMQDQEQ